MAKTVDQFSTIEDFRQKYNELAIDVGDKSGLRTTNSSTVVDALNSLEDKSFFFQEFVYIATAGQTVFTGDDSFNNSLEFRANRIQVFKNTQHLIEGTDFTISGTSGSTHTIITLSSGATVSDKVVVYSFTGSYLGTNIGAGSGVAGQFTETAANTIYNINSNGVILNGDGSPNQTTTLQSGFNIQLAGKTYSEDNIEVASGKTITAPTFIGNLTGNVTGNVSGTSGSSGTVSSISTHSASGLSDINYTTTPTNGQILVWDNANQYWEPTNNGDLSTLSGDSDDITEGTTNLFSTTERIQDAAANMITSATHSNISVTYDDGLGTLAFTAGATYSDSDARNAISGGDGLAFNGGTGVMDANTSNGITTSSDNIVLDYETVSVAPSSVGSTSTGHLWFVI